MLNTPLGDLVERTLAKYPPRQRCQAIVRKYGFEDQCEKDAVSGDDFCAACRIVTDEINADLERVNAEYHIRLAREAIGSGMNRKEFIENNAYSALPVSDEEFQAIRKKWDIAYSGALTQIFVDFFVGRAVANGN